MDPGEASFVRRVMGFRNIVVNEYLGVDMGLVHRIVERREYRRVVALAAELLRRAEERGIDPQPLIQHVRSCSIAWIVRRSTAGLLIRGVRLAESYMRCGDRVWG